MTKPSANWYYASMFAHKPPWSPTLPPFEAVTPTWAVDACSATVVLIWAVWDPVCQTLDAMLAQAQSSYPKLHFWTMNLDEKANWPLAQSWDVQDTRTLVFLLDGDFQESFVIQKLDAVAEGKLNEWNYAAGRSRS